MEAIHQALISLAVAALTAFASYLGVELKRLYAKYVDTKIKKDVARTVVNAVEQLYKDLHGEEKYKKAVAAMSEMLSEKGILISEIEMRMLIEAAVQEFNRNIKGCFSEDDDDIKVSGFMEF